MSKTPSWNSHSSCKPQEDTILNLEPELCVCTPGSKRLTEELPEASLFVPIASAKVNIDMRYYSSAQYL